MVSIQNVVVGLIFAVNGVGIAGFEVFSGDVQVTDVIDPVERTEDVV